MARVYQASARTAATLATANHVLAQLWNPSASVRMIVHEVWVCANAAPTAGTALYLVRSSARGTAGSTVTPTIDNDNERLLAPPSGALLDLAAFSAQPTLSPAAGTNTAGMFFTWDFAAVIGSGIIAPLPRGIVIPAGFGLCLAQKTAVIFPVSDVGFVWEE
jgi:hypothetical protein